MINGITLLGTKHASTDIERRVFYFSNVMSITVIISMMIVFVSIAIYRMSIGWHMIHHSKFYMLTCMVVILLCTLSLVLNKYGLQIFSRIIQVMAVPACLMFLPLFLVSELRVSPYLWFPYIPLGFMVMLHYFFLEEKDKKWLILFSVIYSCISLFSLEILGAFPNSEEGIALNRTMGQYPVSHRITPFLVFWVVFSAIYYPLSRTRKFEKKLLETQHLLEDKNAKMSELIAAKDKFHSIIAHDLRGPFNSVLGLTKIMADNAATISHDELKTYTGMLYSSCENTQKLLENLLQWSHIQTGGMKFKPEPLDLHSITKSNLELLKGMADNKKISLNNYCKEDTKLIADRNMVRTIIRNLTANAIKFTPEGGHIDVSCDWTDELASIVIADSGVGMSEMLIAKLFKIEEKVTSLGTNDEKGTGLGLLLVKEFVDKHNGSIKVESEIGNGSKFIVNIPRNLKAVEST